MQNDEVPKSQHDGITINSLFAMVENVVANRESAKGMVLHALECAHSLGYMAGINRVLKLDKHCTEIVGQLPDKAPRTAVHLSETGTWGSTVSESGFFADKLAAEQTVRDLTFKGKA